MLSSVGTLMLISVQAICSCPHAVPWLKEEDSEDRTSEGVSEGLFLESRPGQLEADKQVTQAGSRWKGICRPKADTTSRTCGFVICHLFYACLFLMVVFSFT